MDLSFLDQRHDFPRTRHLRRGETRKICQNASAVADAAQSNFSDHERVRLDKPSGQLPRKMIDIGAQMIGPHGGVDEDHPASERLRGGA